MAIECVIAIRVNFSMTVIESDVQKVHSYFLFYFFFSFVSCWFQYIDLNALLVQLNACKPLSHSVFAVHVPNSLFRTKWKEMTKRGGQWNTDSSALAHVVKFLSGVNILQNMMNDFFDMHYQITSQKIYMTFLTKKNYEWKSSNFSWL